MIRSSRLLGVADETPTGDAMTSDLPDPPAFSAIVLGTRHAHARRFSNKVINAMRIHGALTVLLPLGLVVACGAQSSRDGEATSSSGATVVAWDRTEVVVYRNDTDATLPAFVPVVISKTAAHTPSAAFRIDCGVNAASMIRGFGYRNFDPDFARRIDSLALLREELGDVPLVPLTCNESASDSIVQIFRLIGADPKKGQSGYYARLHDDPSALYSLGCFNVVRALGWDRSSSGAAWATSVPVPINQVVLDAWTAEQGVALREINCYADQAEAMPPVDEALPVAPAVPPVSDVAALYKVRYRFDGISSPAVPYLISNGRGYAIDCGSNLAGMEASLAFSPEAALPELSTSSSTFTRSFPDEQPRLRCQNPGTTIFETSDESPPARYFVFGGMKRRLVRFACEPTRDFVAAGVTDVRKVPKASIPYIAVDPDSPGPAAPLVVGCGAEDECREHRAACGDGTYCVDAYVGYRCAECAKGFRSADGYRCDDIDECASGTATCGPKTRCVNEAGAYRCDPTETTWTCWLRGAAVGDVTIWWGHQPNDAEWACNSWVSACGNNGGCQATRR
jgi:hypothetical protein